MLALFVSLAFATSTCGGADVNVATDLAAVARARPGRGPRRGFGRPGGGWGPRTVVTEDTSTSQDTGTSDETSATEGTDTAAQAEPTGASATATNRYGVDFLALSGSEAAAYSPQLRAFVRAITYIEGVESSAGYYTEVGGTTYPSTTRVHPGAEDVYRYSRTGYNSDAFGRYQMLSSTWAAWAAAAGIPTARSGENSYGEAYYDIRAAHQDRAVLAFLQREGVEKFLKAGNVSGAAATSAAQNWASMPGASQHNSRTNSFYAVYDALLAEERAR